MTGVQLNSVRSACYLFCSLLLNAQVQRINLTQWGYSSPLRKPEFLSTEGTTRPRLLAFTSASQLIVGFVTRNGNALATRQEPGLTLHALTLNDSGRLVSERSFPVIDWYDNGLFTGAYNTLLVRWGQTLSLYSHTNELLGEKQIPDRNIKILPLPGREAFVVSHIFNGEIEVFSSQALAPLNRCLLGTHSWVTSVSNRNVLINYASLADDPWLRRIQVKQICGPLQFGYQWRDDKGQHATDTTLIDDNHFLLAGPGSSAIEFFDRGIRKWVDSLDKKHESIDPHIAIDENGSTFAIAVLKSAGGNTFLDLDGHRVGIRIIVYRSDGIRLAEISVDHLPSYVFDFAISPDGKTVAVLSDGELQLGSISSR